MVKRSEPVRRREDACYIREEGQAYCVDPLDEVLDVLAKRWTLLIAGVLGNENVLRFNELKRSVPGISARALSDRLTDLAQLRLVNRAVKPGTPPEVEYSLTARGRAMRRALIPVLQWAAEGVLAARH